MHSPIARIDFRDEANDDAAGSIFRGILLHRSDNSLTVDASAFRTPRTQKTNVTLGTNGRPSSIEIVHDDGSRSGFQTDCGNVGDSFLSKDALVIIGCSTVSVIGADGHLSFSDDFSGAGLQFGGASKDGKRFVIAVSALRGGDPPYLTDEWLVVYDAERHAPVFAVKSDPLPYMQSQSALSADGNYLLAGSGGHLSSSEC